VKSNIDTSRTADINFIAGITPSHCTKNLQSTYQ